MPRSPSSPWMSSQDEVQLSAVTRPCGPFSIISTADVSLFSPFRGSIPSHTGAGPSAGVPSGACHSPLVMSSDSPADQLALAASETGAWTLRCYGLGSINTSHGLLQIMLMRPASLRSDPLFWTSADICLLPFIVACIRQTPGALLMPPCLACASRLEQCCPIELPVVVTVFCVPLATRDLRTLDTWPVQLRN